MHELIVFLASYLYLVIIAAAVVIWFLADSQDKRNLLLIAVVALPVAFIIARVLNLVVISPRPFMIDHIQPLVSASTDNGFPSDHTLLAATVAMIVFAYRRVAGLVLLVLAFAVGAGRVLAHAHHPIDVIGSVAIAMVAVWIATLVLPVLQGWRQART